MKEDHKQRFLRDISRHTLKVVHEDGVYRHIRCSRPGSWEMHFDIITWPGALCVDGDMGTFVFRRLHDMFVFFRTDQEHYDRTCRADKLAINPSYWGEKLLAPSPRDAQEYCADSFRQHVQETFDSWKESNQPDYDECTTDADRRQFEEQRDALWSALKNEVLALADDGSIRAYDAARDFRCDEVPGFNLDDCWEWDCKVFKFDFLWNCYAIAWGIKTYDKATQPATTT